MEEIAKVASKESLPEEINIVCNIVVSNEFYRNRKNTFEIKEEMKISFGRVLFRFFSLFFLLLFLFVFFQGFNFFGPYFIFLFFPILIVLSYVKMFYSNNAREVPTNLLLNAEGLKYGWNYQTSSVSEQLPWDKLRYANFRIIKSFSANIRDGEFIDLDFDLSQLSFRRRMALKLQTISLAAVSIFSQPRRAIRERNLVSLTVPLDAFTLESDRLRFANAITRWAPHDALTENFKNYASNTTGPSYTQLWLDDLQSYKRNRLEQLEEGSQLQDGRYIIENEIAAGGQAQIYKARDSHGNSDRYVVLKEFVLPVGAGQDVRNRSFKNVKNEALLLARLNHEGIIHLYDHFVEDHRAYLVLEYIDGVSLRQLVKENGPLSGDILKDYIRDMVAILDYLHGLEPPVVHRDFTPANLVITPQNRVKLLDFNVAHTMESNTTRTVVGKHSYIAPEQFRGKPCPQSDLYSLGGTIFFMVTGADPVPLSQSRPEVGDKMISEIVAKLTAMKVEDRYGSVKEVIEEIQPK